MDVRLRLGKMERGLKAEDRAERQVPRNRESHEQRTALGPPRLRRPDKASLLRFRKLNILEKRDSGMQAMANQWYQGVVLLQQGLMQKARAQSATGHERANADKEAPTRQRGPPKNHHLHSIRPRVAPRTPLKTL